MKKYDQPVLILCIYWGAAFLLTQNFAAAVGAEIVAISATASSEYKREKLPNGNFAPETFAFGQGGLWSEVTVDSSIDKIKFLEVAQTIAPALAHTNYISSRDSKTTRLLIMVYWGKTNAPVRRSESLIAQNSDRASGNRGEESLEEAVAMEELENEHRDKINAENANLLGYDEDWNRTLGKGKESLSYRRRDLVDELEEKRYFVILMAYDFQLLWKQKTHKLLWETRFSIRDRGHQFDKALNAMAWDASKYFGQTTHGVVHKELPEGKIEFGDVKVIDNSPTK